MAQNQGNYLTSAQSQHVRLIAIVKPMPRTTECGSISDTPTASAPVRSQSQVGTDNHELTPEDTGTRFNTYNACVAFRELILGQLWTDERLSVSGAARFIGCKISLTSRSNIRYEGIVYKIQLDAVSISLVQVRVFGTEDRVTARPTRPSRRIRNLLTFCFTRVKDVHLLELPQPQNVPHRAIQRMNVRNNRAYNLRRQYNTNENQ